MGMYIVCSDPVQEFGDVNCLSTVVYCSTGYRSYVDSSEAMYHEWLTLIDLDVISTIFGGSLLLLTTGIGFGWLLSVIRLMK